MQVQDQLLQRMPTLPRVSHHFHNDDVIADESQHLVHGISFVHYQVRSNKIENKPHDSHLHLHFSQFIRIVYSLLVEFDG